MKSVSITNISGKLTLEPYGNGIRLSADDAVIIVDDAAIGPTNPTIAETKIYSDGTVATGTAPLPPLSPAQQGYSSEIADLASISSRWSGRVDAQGRMIAKDGSLMTQLEPTDPLPTDFGNGTIDEQVAILLGWQLTHPSYHPQFYADGHNPIGQPGSEPGVYFSTAGGKLHLDPDRQVPTPPPILPLASGKDQIIRLTWPAGNQMQLRTTGFTTNTLAFELAVPKTFVATPGHRGNISMVEVPGDARTMREIGVSRTPYEFTNVNVMAHREAVAPSIDFAVGPMVPGAAFVVQPGDVFYVNVRNQLDGVSTLKPGKRGNILFNLKTPNSY